MGVFDSEKACKKGEQDMICPKCKSEIKDDSKFCGKCGQKIPRCPTCGRPILERARFCVYDGTMIPDDMLNLLPEETAEDITCLLYTSPSPRDA